MPEINIGKISDFSVGTMKKIEIKNKGILIANIDGKLYAIGDVCTHEECSLSDGMLQKNIVICPCHNAQFDLKTGKNIEKPFTGEDIEDEPSYQIKIKNNEVFIVI